MHLKFTNITVLVVYCSHFASLDSIASLGVDEEEILYIIKKASTWSQNVPLFSSLPLYSPMPSCSLPLPPLLSSLGLVESTLCVHVMFARRWDEPIVNGVCQATSATLAAILNKCSLSVLCPVCGCCGLAPKITAKAQPDRLCVFSCWLCYVQRPSLWEYCGKTFDKDIKLSWILLSLVWSSDSRL